VGALVVAGLAGLVLTGGAVEATITEKGSDEYGPYVVATTDVGGLEFQRYIPGQEWALVQEGNHVVYHLITGETEIYSWEGGWLLWRG
jgi:hypothetical protein